MKSLLMFMVLLLTSCNQVYSPDYEVSLRELGGEKHLPENCAKIENNVVKFTDEYADYTIRFQPDTQPFGSEYLCISSNNAQEPTLDCSYDQECDETDKALDCLLDCSWYYEVKHND